MTTAEAVGKMTFEETQDMLKECVGALELADVISVLSEELEPPQLLELSVWINDNVDDTGTDDADEENIDEDLEEDDEDESSESDEDDDEDDDDEDDDEDDDDEEGEDEDET